MAVATPLTNIKSLSLRVTVKVDGTAIKDDYGLVSVNVLHAINKISTAEVVLVGPMNTKSGEIPITDGADFDPGKELEISAGFGDSGEQTIFKGLIVKHAAELDNKSPFKIKVFCKHKAVTMTFNEKEGVFTESKDSDIITKITGNYGLSADVTATTVTYEACYQRRSTDWDFVLSRADFNGFIICMDGDSFTVGKPKLSETAVQRVAVGESMISFEAELNAENQPTAINASGWDTKTQALVKSAAAEPSVNSQGNVTAKTLSGKLSQAALNLLTPTPMATDELKVWADAALLRMRLNACRGKVKFVGSATVKTGNIIELAGVGKKFNGSAFVSSVNHVIEAGSWNTIVKFGLENSQIHKMPDFSYASASGQLPAVHGLQVGTVKKLSEDPKSLARIQVTLPSYSETSPDIWARYANFYATGDAGSGFWPEVGDEVIVGFLDNDPRYPVVLGSVYSDKNKSPNPPADENNYIKSLTTKTKMKLSFDDEKKVIVIETPGGNKITISDEDKSIEIKDQNSNTIKMSSSGIDLDSGKDINIKATGSININATQKLTLDAKQDVAVSGLNVNHTAKVGFTAKGNATAEISASGSTTVKGGMVMIN
ncbi:type VI secretion system tip protein VgrG [Sediminibacterium ginsengisoli]|uniref:Rhs element Vgr protein n=1 Tax=Sediminibacterium ginsengisoli TaxID=413434 RepID=A0A1T4PNV7_9BACT|nr:type VI secretion system tip protein VgrG [Sediminibacterium ginsengisoli]SJZ92588.1 Rhs element Vgr protein [Sediminibacterium ginsengisoli]